MRACSANYSFECCHGDRHLCIWYFLLCLWVSYNASHKHVFKLLAPLRWEEAASRGTVKKSSTLDSKTAPAGTKPSWFTKWVWAGRVTGHQRGRLLDEEKKRTKERWRFSGEVIRGHVDLLTKSILNKVCFPHGHSINGEDTRTDSPSVIKNVTATIRLSFLIRICVFEWLTTLLGEALNPTVMATWHCAWGVLVYILSFTLLSSFLCVSWHAPSRNLWWFWWFSYITASPPKCPN